MGLRTTCAVTEALVSTDLMLRGARRRGDYGVMKFTAAPMVELCARVAGVERCAALG